MFFLLLFYMETLINCHLRLKMIQILGLFKILVFWERNSYFLRVFKYTFLFTQGYAPKQLLDDNLPKMNKKIDIIAEELMKVLMSLDELSFTETQKEARAKRKCLVDRIHLLHKTCDELTASVQQLLIEHKKT